MIALHQPATDYYSIITELSILVVTCNTLPRMMLPRHAMQIHIYITYIYQNYNTKPPEDPGKPESEVQAVFER